MLNFFVAENKQFSSVIILFAMGKQHC